MPDSFEFFRLFIHPWFTIPLAPFVSLSRSWKETVTESLSVIFCCHVMSRTPCLKLFAYILYFIAWIVFAQLFLSARIENGWVTPLLTFPPQYSGDSTWPRLKSNWRVYQQKNRAIVLLSAGTWLPCPLKRLLFWGFLHRITSEIAITNGYQP